MEIILINFFHIFVFLQDRKIKEVVIYDFAFLLNCEKTKNKTQYMTSEKIHSGFLIFLMTSFQNLGNQMVKDIVRENVRRGVGE